MTINRDNTPWGSDVPISMPEGVDDDTPVLVDLDGWGFTAMGFVHNLTQIEREAMSTPFFAPAGDAISERRSDRVSPQSALPPIPPPTKISTPVATTSTPEPTPEPEPEPTVDLPAPWAWFRSDDLTDGKTWADRAGDRDMMLAGTGSDPVVNAAALDGFPELSNSTTTSKALQADFAAYPMPNGATVMIVARDGYGFNMKTFLGMSGVSNVEVYWDPATGWVEGLGFGGGRGGTDPRVTSGFHVIMFTITASLVDLWLDGSSLAVTDYAQLSPTSISAAAAVWLNVEPQGPLNGLVEYIVWDRTLSLADRTAAFDYADARYPSLAMTP